MFVQTGPRGLTFLQLHKNCLAQLIMILVVGMQVRIHFTIFNQLNITHVAIPL